MVVIAKLRLQGKLQWVSDVRNTFSFLAIKIARNISSNWEHYSNGGDCKAPPTGRMAMSEWRQENFFIPCYWDCKKHFYQLRALIKSWWLQSSACRANCNGWVTSLKLFHSLQLRLQEIFLATESTIQMVVIAKLRLQGEWQWVSDVRNTFSFLAIKIARNISSNWEHYSNGGDCKAPPTGRMAMSEWRQENFFIPCYWDCKKHF